MVTNNFSMRFITSMLGFLIVNCFFALRYHYDELADFIAQMDRLGLKLMQNPDASASSGESPERSARASPTMMPDGDVHMLTPLKHVPGLAWKKGMQQRCVMCNHHTVWVCATCTTGPTGLVPLCPESTVVRKGDAKGQTHHHPCLHKHMCNPTFMPKGRATRKAKRARPPPEADEAAPGEECSDCSDSDGEH